MQITQYPRSTTFPGSTAFPTVSWWLLFCLAVMFTLSAATIEVAHAERVNRVADLPMSGVPVPALAAFDQTMQQFMAERSIKAGELTVMKNGVIVLERGYGWQDKSEQRQLPPDALFRLASIIKPVTSAAIKKLAVAGKLSLSDPVFCLPGSPASCLLGGDATPSALAIAID